MESVTTYDLVSYPGWPYPQSHPDRLATLATLFGMTPADPGACRVLELGCGDGANLLPFAYACPGSRSLGIDLASTAIERGRRVAQELGLANIQLHTGDLTRLADDLGEFDFIIAHGVYSWVPEPVRGALLDACRRLLAPQGVAFVSYNVYPGGHVRKMLREALLMHAEGIEGTVARTASAREFLAWISDAQGAGAADAAPSALALEAGRLARRADGGIFHDDLSDEFHLCYFRDFCAQAEAHGLQYMAEADFFEMQDHGLSPTARERLAAFAPGLIEREQYLDFLKERRFRQTLLCRSGVALRSEVRADALRELSISSSAKPDGDKIDPSSRKEQRYRGRAGATFATNEPLLKVAIDLLQAEWPRALRMTDLLEASAARCGIAAGDAGQRALADFALGCYAAGSVELHVRQPSFARRPAHKPRASALARLQVQRGDTATGLIGNMVALDDPLARRVLALLDGSRDRAALLREIGAGSGSNDTAALERCLDALAYCALLHEERAAP